MRHVDKCHSISYLVYNAYMFKNTYRSIKVTDEAYRIFDAYIYHTNLGKKRKQTKCGLLGEYAKKLAQKKMLEI